MPIRRIRMPKKTRPSGAVTTSRISKFVRCSSRALVCSEPERHFFMGPPKSGRNKNANFSLVEPPSHARRNPGGLLSMSAFAERTTVCYSSRPNQTFVRPVFLCAMIHAASPISTAPSECPSCFVVLPSAVTGVAGCLPPRASKSRKPRISHADESHTVPACPMALPPHSMRL